MVGFVRLPAGADLRPATKGLPDDLCPCPRWGYMLKGRVWMHTTDGHQDLAAGEAFYWAAGHAPRRSRTVNRSTSRRRGEFQRVLDHLTGAPPPAPDCRPEARLVGRAARRDTAPMDPIRDCEDLEQGARALERAEWQAARTAFESALQAG